MRRILQNTYMMMLLAILVVAVSSCTRNNGDIGDYFGTWRLDAIDIASVDAASGEHFEETKEVKDVFWGFQNGVIMMERYLSSHQLPEQFYGTWSESDDGTWLTLDFTHSDNYRPTGTGIYAMLKEIYLPEKEVVGLEIKKLDKKSMVLVYIDTVESKTYTYYFTKW